jgi:hypothetical protein
VRDEETRETHPSYGMVGVSRRSSTGQTLFGSEFRHQNFISIRIQEAERIRSLSNDHYHATGQLIEICMSEAQWVEMISRGNMGDGVPCTLSWIRGIGYIEEPPAPVPLKERFRNDIKDDAKRCVTELREAEKELSDAIESGQIGKTKLREILKKIHYAGCAVDSGIPFVQDQFEEAMETVVRHASAEIEATVTNTAIRLGLDRMRQVAEGAPKMIEGKASE